MYIYKDKGKWTAAFAPGSIWETHPVAWSLVPWAPIFLGWWDNMWDIDVYKYDILCGILWVFIVRGGDGTVVGVYMLNHVHATCGHAGRWDLHPIGTGTSPNMQLPHPDQMRFLPPGGFSIAIRDVACCCHKTRNPISVPDWLRLVDSRRQM